MPPRSLSTPDCCKNCPEYKTQCACLAEPHRDNRSHILTCQCRVPDILEVRFKELAGSAIARWLGLSWSVDKIRASFGNLPLDQRFWLSRWPYNNLVRTDQRREHLHSQRMLPSPMDIDYPANLPEQTSVSPEDVLDTQPAIISLYDISIVDCAIVAEIRAGCFKGKDWAQRSGKSSAAISNMKYRALYRLAVLRYGILSKLERDAPLAHAALKARFFTPGADTERAAYDRLKQHPDPPVFLHWKRQVQEGAEATLFELARPQALGPKLMEQFMRPLRRALGLPPRREIASPTDPTTPAFSSTHGAWLSGTDVEVHEALLLKRLIPLVGHDHAHIAEDVWSLTVRRELPPWLVGVVMWHLFVCDGRCQTLVWKALEQVFANIPPTD